MDGRPNLNSVDTWGLPYKAVSIEPILALVLASWVQIYQMLLSIEISMQVLQAYDPPKL